MTMPCSRPAPRTRSRLHWPAIAAAAVFSVVFISGLTLAALVIKRPGAEPRAQPRLAPVVELAELPALEEPAAPQQEPVSTAEPVPPADVPVPLPERGRSAPGLDEILANVAGSLPTQVPSPWPTTVARDEPPAPAAPVAAPRPPVTCGTSVEFQASPAEAARRAQQEKKLLFLLHVSGDFEDPGFT